MNWEWGFHIINQLNIPKIIQNIQPDSIWYVDRLQIQTMDGSDGLLVERRRYPAHPSFMTEGHNLGVELPCLSVEQLPQSTEHRSVNGASIAWSLIDITKVVYWQLLGPPQGQFGWSLGNRAQTFRP